MANGWDVVYWFFWWAPLWGKVDQTPKDLAEIVENGRVQPGKSLDVGCGTGGIVRYLASHGFESSGVDISSVVIKKAKAKARRFGVDATFKAMSWIDPDGVAGLNGPFDLVVDRGCLHSIRPADRAGYVPSLKRVTAPGSHYLLWAFVSRVSSDWVKQTFSDAFELLDEHPVGVGRKNFYWMRRR